MGFLLRVLLWLALPVTVVGGPAAVTWLALEREPLVARMAEISAEDMRSAKVFWERTIRAASRRASRPPSSPPSARSTPPFASDSPGWATSRAASRSALAAS